MEGIPEFKKDSRNNPVWTNTRMDALRRTECLCLNCGHMKPGKPDHCTIAAQLYDICVEKKVAMAITRCPVWMPKE